MWCAKAPRQGGTLPGASDADRAAPMLLDVPISTANAVRRTLLADLPGLAVLTVDVFTFDCNQPEEYVVHRVAMLPVVDDQDADPEAAPREVSPLLTLDVRCGDAEERRDVTDRDFVCDTPGVRVWVGQAPVQVARLRRGQHVRLEARVGRGTPSQHAKFASVSAAFYRIVPTVTVPEGADRAALREVCPRGVFDIEDAPPDAISCVECGACAGAGVRVEKGRSVWFEVEPLTPHRSPEFLVRRAVALLLKNLQRTSRTVGQL